MGQGYSTLAFSSCLVTLFHYESEVDQLTGDDPCLFPMALDFDGLVHVAQDFDEGIRFGVTACFILARTIGASSSSSSPSSAALRRASGKWIPVTDQLLLIISVVLTHMVGVVPADWPFTIPRKHKLNDHVALEGTPISDTDFAAMANPHLSHHCLSGKLFGIVSSEKLKDALAYQHGLFSAKVIYEKHSGRSRGFGFVTFSSLEAVEFALSAMNGMVSLSNNSNVTIPRRSNRRRVSNIVEPEIRTIEEIVPMADRTMEELLQAPTEGYGEAIVILKILAENFEIKTNLLQLVQTNKFYGFEMDNPHTHISNFKRMTSTLKYRDVPNDATTSGTLPSNIVTNPKGEMKVVTTRSGLAYEGPSIPTNSPLEKVVERETEETTDKEHSNCQGSSAHIQPPFVPISILEPDVPKTQPKPNIPYLSRLNDQKLREKDTNQMEKFFQIFHDLHFDISFADALLLMPKFASTIKSLLTNKDKLFESAKVPLNENCLAMLLKKLPEKLRDPGKFLIPCDFLGIDVCHALADLGASINLMPLSIWKKLSLPKLTPTRMTLELADRTITRPKGVAEDVFVKVRKFHFSTDFVVVDFEADPRVPLILGRSFLRTGHALIDVYGEEKTLRVNDESVSFNLNQTMRYSPTYDDNSVNRVDVIEIACEEFVQDVLDF
nr:reverse transcriptase domain-containing protein [Tanacetum cinerariifolium]